MEPRGLTTAVARERLARSGPNELPQPVRHPMRALLGKFWAPVPWMLEAAVVLELLLRHLVQALIIFLLLVVNALLGFLEEDRSQRALALLRQRLRIEARVLRDGRWQRLPARELVVGDVVHLRVGDITPADCCLLDGLLQEDRSVLTGESVPADVSPGARVFAGSTLRRGEATAEVTHTGAGTFFGTTAELVRTARAPSRLEAVVLHVVERLVSLDVGVLAGILVRAAVTGEPLSELLPFALMLLVASVPVALPATFTLAGVLGARDLSERGVLVSQLRSLEEAASLDEMCCDKTGTLTENRLRVQGVHVFGDTREEELLAFACLASDAATQDPIDLALLQEAARREVLPAGGERLSFIPFEPATRRTEAVVRRAGGTLRVLKGAPKVLASAAMAPPELSATEEGLASRGARVLAVAVGPEGGPLIIVGLIGLEDPPRTDSRGIVEALQRMGVRVRLITGDGLATARTFARSIGLDGQAATGPEVRSSDTLPEDTSVVAEVYPEDKYRIVRHLQRAGHLVGMTGDGVNDAPALRQANVGVAVAHATDVAKAAAGLVLIREGLTDIPFAIMEGRRIFQRLLTYTLNKIVKTVQVVLLVGGAFLLAGEYVTQARLLVLLLFFNDFATMSLATDHVHPSDRPERWNVRAVTALALGISLVWTAFGAAVVALSGPLFGLGTAQMQTLVFLSLVFTGQATLYLVRERRHLWRSRPSRWLAISSSLALVGPTILATRGWLMAPVPWRAVAWLILGVLLLLAVLDSTVLASRFAATHVSVGAARAPHSALDDTRGQRGAVEGPPRVPPGRGVPAMLQPGGPARIDLGPAGERALGRRGARAAPRPGSP